MLTFFELPLGFLSLRDPWKERLTAWHLEMAFRVIGTACRQTIECGGGNNYRLAHDGHRKAMIAEGWIQPKWCR